jgi:hypothetical protein
MDLCYCVHFLTVRVIIQWGYRLTVRTLVRTVSLRSEATYIYDSRFDNNHYTLIYFDSPNLGLQQLIYIHFHVFVISRHLRKLINGYIHDSTRLPLLEPTVRAGLKRHNARQNSRTSSPTPPPTPPPTPTPGRTPGHRRLRAVAYAYAPRQTR